MKRNLLILFVLFALSIAQASAQNKTITGTVTGQDDGLPLPGVSVRAPGSALGTATNPLGQFKISVPAKTNTLIFSYLGFTTQTVTIGTKTVIDIKLAPDNKALSEVVVVGYQTIQRQNVVGALSTVDAKQFDEKPIISFTNDLQGAATGVQVVAGSGRPGDNGVIRVRGTGSITASSDPLIVLDGTPITSAAYIEINPDDIATVTILKDAQSVAIYGSRGSNGVILVTTKTGKANEPVIHYSYRYGASQREPLSNETLMNSPQKLQYEYEVGFQNPTIDSMITDRVNTGALPTGATLFNVTAAQRQNLWDVATSRGAGDWSQYLFQNAISQTNELSLSGGSDKLTYFASAQINKNPGVERFSDLNRNGGRLNVAYQVYDWFKIGANTGVTSSHEDRVREAYNTQNSDGALYFFNPYEQPYLSDGEYNPTANGFSPLEGATKNPTTYDRVSDFGTFYGEAKFLKHLTIKSQFALDYNTLNYQSYLEPGSNLANILGYNQKEDEIQQDLLYTFTNTANWNETFGTHHSINLLIGNEYDKDNTYTLDAVGRGFPSAQQTTLENAATPTKASTSLTQYSLISYFASAAYDFDKRFFINVSGRRDGSSLFGANVQFANFGAVGAAWDLKNEKLFTLPNWVSELKLRASYGTSGNNNIPLYQALGLYSLTTKYNNQVTSVPSTLANPNLTWETSLAKDLGITYGFLDSRLTGEIDYYDRTNKNLLYPVNVSATTGFSSYTGNVGAVRNKGVELAASYDIVRSKGLKWTVNASYSHNDNSVTQLYSNNANGVSANGLSKLVVGEPINVFYMVKDLGVNPADGKEVYANINGTTTETYSGSQSQVISGESALVKYFGSFGTTVTYKGIDFSTSFYYSGGNYIYNVPYQDATNAGDYTQNLFTSAENYWKKPGDVTEFPNALDPSQQVEYTTTKFLEKGDYLELRDATLGYTFKKEWTKRAHINNLRFFAQGTNLYVWTKFHGNPEVSEAGETTSFSGSLYQYGYPPIRSYTFGVDVRF